MQCCTLCLCDKESGDSIRSSVILLSCLGLMLSPVEVAALHGFKMFCLDLGRFVFARWCGSSLTDGLSEEKLDRDSVFCNERWRKPPAETLGVLMWRRSSTSEGW